jgi:hypothetical protein
MSILDANLPLWTSFDAAEYNGRLQHENRFVQEFL